MELSFEDGCILIFNVGSDGFFNNFFFKDGIVVLFDLIIGWFSKQGIYFWGSVGFEVKIFVYIELGVIEI